MKKSFVHTNLQLFVSIAILAILAGCIPSDILTVSPTSTPFPLQRFTYNRYFGNGYIAHIPSDDFDPSHQEDSVKLMISKWFDYYKAQSQNPDYRIIDYKIENLGFLDISKGTGYEYVIKVDFSIIPAQIPNQWASLPGEPITSDNIWWHFPALFGITNDGEFFNIFLLTAKV